MCVRCRAKALGSLEPFSLTVDKDKEGDRTKQIIRTSFLLLHMQMDHGHCWTDTQEAAGRKKPGYQKPERWHFPPRLLLNSFPSYPLPPNISLYHLKFCCKAWSGEGNPKASEQVESLTFPLFEFKLNTRTLFSHTELAATRRCREKNSSRFGKNMETCIKTNTAVVLISSNTL